MTGLGTHPILTLPQSPVTSGDTFLLPVCLNSAELNRLIDLYMAGMWTEYEPTNPYHDLTGIMPVFEAMAFVDNPGETSCGAEFPEGEGCSDHLPNVGFVAYAPNDPFSTPTYIPEGYIIPPWYNNPLIPQPGVLSTDAMVNGASLPVFASLPDMLASGLPRVRINFSGMGELEIEFVGVIQGGYVLCTVDGNPLINRIYDLNAYSVTDASIIEDIFDVIIGQALNSTVTAEFQFTTAGNHFVDVTFLPQLSADTILGFGGGIRRISLCEGLEVGETIMPELQQTLDGCGIEWRPSSAHSWVILVEDICGADGATGATGATGAAGAAGAVGATGATGAAGATGATGATGAAGAPGATGAAGAAGAVGATGATGATGAAGADGANGEAFKPYYTPEERLSVAIYLTEAICALAENAITQATAVGTADVEYWRVLVGLPNFLATSDLWAGLLNTVTNPGLVVSLGMVQDVDVIERFICSIYVNLPIDLVIEDALDFGLSVENDWDAGMLAEYPSSTTNQRDIISLLPQSIRREGWQDLIVSALMAKLPIGVHGAGSCLPDTGNLWARHWQFSGGSFGSSFAYTNAVWVGGSGYRPTGALTTMSIKRINTICVGALAEFAVSVGDRVIASFRDVGANITLASIDHVDSLGSPVPNLVWEAPDDYYAESGIELLMSYVDADGNGTIAYVPCFAITGVDDTPADGASGGC